MFKLPARPSSRADIHELADFAELLAWANGRISAREIVAFLGREGESYPNDGCEDVDDDNADALDEVSSEIEKREKACSGRYPFELDSAGNVLHYRPKDEVSTWLYGYMLLSTRLNMNSDRMQAGIDGTTLLEEISAEGLRRYLGLGRAKSMVFGTAAGCANFPARVTALCKDVGEGYQFRNNQNIAMNAKDDKLDVVAWLPFADNESSKIIVFGQCKTGTAWTEQLCHLQPDSFIKKWIDIPFTYDPARAYLVSESIDRSKWKGYAIDGGVLLDRCRLVDCCDQIDPALLARVTAWSTGALAFAKSKL